VTEDTVSLRQAAEETGVKADTLRRWARSGVIPGADGGAEWTRAAVAHARIVARLRDRGHSLGEIRQASQDGRLAYGYLEDLFPEARGGRTVEQVAEETGLQPALVERIWTALGFPRSELDQKRSIRAGSSPVSSAASSREISACSSPKIDSM